MDKIGDALANGRPWEAVDIQRNAGQYDPFFNSSVRDMLEADRSVKIDDALQNGKPWIAVDHMGSVGKYDALFDATAQIARYTPFISPIAGGVEIWGDTLHTAQQGASLMDIQEQAYASTVAVMAGEVIETGVFMAGSAAVAYALALPVLALATPVVVGGAIVGGLVTGVLAGAYYADENYIHDKGESYSSRFKEWLKDSEPTFKPVNQIRMLGWGCPVHE